MADDDSTSPKITDKTFAIGDLKSDPKNAKVHSEGQIAEIAESISTFGYVNKIAVRPTGQLIGGHATLEALRRLGREKIETRCVAGLTEVQYSALGLALNRLPENSSWDERVLADVLGAIRDEDPELITGFKKAEIDKLLEEPDEIEVQEIETDRVDDEFWISVRGPLADQAAALQALQDVMRKFPGVSVDLGTINVG